jgi:hypothetical protein
MNQNDPSRAARKRRAQERIASASVVPGFPEIIRAEARCRLCQFATTDPELLQRVHVLYFNGHGVRSLEQRTLHIFDARGETPLRARCFARHFRSHVSEELAAYGDELEEEYALNPKATSVPRAKDALKPATTPAPIPEDEEAAAYFDMRDLLHKLRTRMKEVDNTVTFVDDHGQLNAYGLQLWLKFVDSFRQALEAMNRIRNNDRLTKAILQAHTKRNYNLASAPLIARFEEVLTKLRNKAPGAVDDFERLALYEAREILEQAARSAVQESCDVYRLH